MHLSRQQNLWSLRCSWSIACRHCSNYIFILDLTPGFNGLGKAKCKTRREALMFRDLVRLVLEVWRHNFISHSMRSSHGNNLRITGPLKLLLMPRFDFLFTWTNCRDAGIAFSSDSHLKWLQSRFKTFQICLELFESIWETLLDLFENILKCPFYIWITSLLVTRYNSKWCQFQLLVFFLLQVH